MSNGIHGCSQGETSKWLKMRRSKKNEKVETADYHGEFIPRSLGI
jgi:hypothetical protein